MLALPFGYILNDFTSEGVSLCQTGFIKELYVTQDAPDVQKRSGTSCWEAPFMHPFEVG